MRRVQIPGRDSSKSDQEVVIRSRLDMIPGRRRSVQDNRRQILAVGFAQILDQPV
jgi:hypothetical protein